MPVAIQRADHITAAVHVEQGRIATVLRRRGPLCPHPVCSDRLDRDVACDSILRETSIHILTALPVIVRTYSAGQLATQRADFGIAHCILLCRRSPSYHAARRPRGPPSPSRKRVKSFTVKGRSSHFGGGAAMRRPRHHRIMGNNAFLN